jgi:hypothetical protein
VTHLRQIMIEEFLRGLRDAKGASPSEPGYFIKLDKIWLFATSAAVPKGTCFYRKGEPEGGGCVQNRLRPTASAARRSFMVPARTR